MDEQTKSLAQITVDDLAKLFAATMNETPRPDFIRRDIEDGAPVNPDGTINLVHYTAWMLKREREQRLRRDRFSRYVPGTGGTRVERDPAGPGPDGA